jgi:flagellar biosynthesis/type III secretory pathway protein FliH
MTMTATLFDKIRQEGWQKGWQEGKEEGKLEGKEEGKLEGREEGLRQSLVTVLEARFGPLSQSILDRVSSLPSEWLGQLLRAATTADSIQAIGLENA